jgi:hypothetical protein
MAEINQNDTIGEVVARKGPKASALMEEILCREEGNLCCPGSTICIVYAAELKGTSPGDLSSLLVKLNELPDINR